MISTLTKRHYMCCVGWLLSLCFSIVCVSAQASPDKQNSHNELIIKLNPTYLATQARTDLLEKLSAKYSIVLQPALTIGKSAQRQLTSLDLWYTANSTTGMSVQDLKSQLKQEPSIALAGLNQSFTPTAVIPNDPLIMKQWSLLHENNASTNNHPTVAAIEAWELETGNTDVIVAVLDTGVDYTHEDLKDNMWINEIEANGIDNFDDDGNGCVDDVYGCDFRSNVREKIGYYPGLGGAFYNSEKYIYPDGMGHGTMVAGIIGAVGNNQVGIAGVAWNTRIMAVKFINQNNAANMVDAAVAIKYAVDNGAKIINSSFGRQRIDEESVQLIEDAIEYANANGVLMIASAGNSGVDIDNNNYFYPANSRAENLITVAALNEQDRLWDYSNYGPISVDIAAPGVAIWTTVPAGPTSLFRKYYDPSGYMVSEGTSIATPYVTGVAALLFSHFPGITHHQVKQLILGSAEYLATLNNKVVSGGKVNLYNALSASY